MLSPADEDKADENKNAPPPTAPDKNTPEGDEEPASPSPPLRPWQAVWGLDSKELRKYSILCCTFMLIIGTYWLIRPMKDGVFSSLVGLEHQPKAKMLSLCVIVPLILLYTKMVDLFEKQKLFYAICSIYSFLLIVISMFLGRDLEAAKMGRRTSSGVFIGWFLYFVIESYGSLLVAMFWSFVSSTSTHSEAKKGYPLIVSGSQIGSILGPTITTYADTIGIPSLFFLGGINTAAVILLIYYFVHSCLEIPLTLPLREGDVMDPSKDRKRPPTGLLEGLILLFTRPYVLGIFGVSTLYEVVGTIMDYQLKVLGKEEYNNTVEFTMFLARFGQCTNVLALVFSFLGTGFLMRRFGVAFCLLLFPSLVLAVVIYVFYFPKLSNVFIAMICIKGLSYALNNPAKEIMYIPTSQDIRYKAKSWIDMFGGRLAKASGSSITNAFKHSAEALIFNGTLISIGLIGIWIVIAGMTGQTFNVLTREKRIVK